MTSLNHQNSLSSEAISTAVATIFSSEIVKYLALTNDKYGPIFSLIQIAVKWMITTGSNIDMTTAIQVALLLLVVLVALYFCYQKYYFNQNQAKYVPDPKMVKHFEKLDGRYRFYWEPGAAVNTLGEMLLEEHDSYEGSYKCYNIVSKTNSFTGSGANIESLDILIVDNLRWEKGDIFFPYRSKLSLQEGKFSSLKLSSPYVPGSSCKIHMYDLFEKDVLKTEKTVESVFWGLSVVYPSMFYINSGVDYGGKCIEKDRSLPKGVQVYEACAFGLAYFYNFNLTLTAIQLRALCEKSLVPVWKTGVVPLIVEFKQVLPDGNMDQTVMRFVFDEKVNLSDEKNVRDPNVNWTSLAKSICVTLKLPQNFKTLEFYLPTDFMFKLKITNTPPVMFSIGSAPSDNYSNADSQGKYDWFVRGENEQAASEKFEKFKKKVLDLTKIRGMGDTKFSKKKVYEVVVKTTFSDVTDRVEEKKEEQKEKEEGDEDTKDTIKSRDARMEKIYQLSHTVGHREIGLVDKEMSCLFLPKEQESMLKLAIRNFSNGRIHRAMGIPHKLGIVLYGEPGCGKSSTIKAVASELNRDIYIIKLSQIHTNKALRDTFSYIRDLMTPGVMVFEDVDVDNPVVLKREYFTPSKSAIEDALNLSTLLDLFQGTGSQSGQVFIMTTNRFECLDEALVRSGRFDLRLHLRRLDHYQFNRIYMALTQKEMDPEQLAKIPEYTYHPFDVIYRFASMFMESGEIDVEQCLQSISH